MLQGELSALLLILTFCITFLLSYHLSLRSLFGLFLSGRFTQVLLYFTSYLTTSSLSVNTSLIILTLVIAHSLNAL